MKCNHLIILTWRANSIIISNIMNKKIIATQPSLAPFDEVNILMKEIWSSGIMTHNGPLVQRFENLFSDLIGVPSTVTCVNGTIALQMAIRALKLKGEIITTPFTFIATASAIIWEHCIPVFVDIDPETLNIDATKIEEKITYHTVGIIPVHVFGNACDIDDIGDIAKRHNLHVIYDAAHAVGVNYKGKSVLNYGDISCTSFNANKILNTAEGGACFTQDTALDQKLRRIRVFGCEDFSDVIEDGTNAKMTEIHAAVGIANLKYLDRFLADRKKKYFYYKDRLSEVSAIRFQRITEDCNYSYMPIIFKTEENLLKAKRALSEEGISSRRYFYPSLNTYSKLFPYVECPESEKIAVCCLCLPIYYALSYTDMDKIILTIKNSLV